MHGNGLVLIAFAAVALGGPLLLGLLGLIRSRNSAGADGRHDWDWRLTVRSGLLYALAFNLIFFVQELFLVLPKALTPGLQPTLYHNNHSWQGDHPLESLFQGTGALAIFVTGLAFALQVARGASRRSDNARLLFIWLTFHGLFQSLPQVVVGAIDSGNDVGMAMDYFQLTQAAKTAAALAALAAIPLVGIWLTRHLLSLAGDADRIGDAAARMRFIFQSATLPAFAAVPVIILFRVPRELIEVIVPPIAVTVVGIAWIQACAWRVTGARRFETAAAGSIRRPLAALVLLLLIFQLILRPGIAF